VGDHGLVKEIPASVRILKMRGGPGRSDVDCTVGDTCNDADQALQHLIAALTKALRRGELFFGSGRCIENLATSCTRDGDCGPREFCAGAQCHRQHGACAKDGRCVGR
jgi:hypothetical protein